MDSFFRMITGFVCTFPRTRFGEEKNKYNFMVCLLLRCFLVIRVIIGSCARSGKYFATKGLRSIGLAFFIRDERIIILYSAGILFELIRILNRIYIQFLLFSFLKVISCYCSCLKFDPLIQKIVFKYFSNFIYFISISLSRLSRFLFNCNFFEYESDIFIISLAL